MPNTEVFQAIGHLKADLASNGLLLCDIKPVLNLPDSVWLAQQPAQYQSGCLLLIGHAGRKFWEVFSKSQSGEGMQHPDPIDRYSTELSRLAIKKHLNGVNYKQLFPEDDCPINLMALGKALAWHLPSPLGMGIHQEYGLWSAYRAVWWLDMEFPQDDKGNIKPKVVDNFPNISGICQQCPTQDCVKSCPADAISMNSRPNLGRCADYRLEEESQCESTCLSRMACPYASQHRYTDTQMSYHYELTRSAIAKYRSQSQ